MKKYIKNLKITENDNFNLVLNYFLFLRLCTFATLRVIFHAKPQRNYFSQMGLRVFSHTKPQRYMFNSFGRFFQEFRIISFRIILPLLFFIVLFFSTGCDEIESPYRKGNVQFIDTTNKILLEEFTGAYCGNCPDGAAKAHLLDSLYPGKFILLSIHAGYYATPNKTFTYDFRTPAGDSIFNSIMSIKEIVFPSAMFNRIGVNKNGGLIPSQWDALVGQLIFNDTVIATIDLAPSFTSTDSSISVKANIKYWEAGSNNQTLVVQILEDSIVQMQKWYGHTPENIPDYVHNNVLRASITPAFGAQITTDAMIMKGSKYEKNLKYTIPKGKDWRINKLKIVAYILDYGKTNSILQAEEMKLIE
ncbi:MAG: hypothetical protein HW421_2708 [Ignavibacteria bacterium]|nr:hypothetical protein [Ignavibacteria bacterium]